MVAAVYTRIARFTQRIRDEGSVTKRRAACTELRELLGHQRNMDILVQEASGKKALQAVWTTILQAALLAANKSINKKSAKYPKEDILFPYYMLLRLDEFTKIAKTDSLLSSKQVRDLLLHCIDLLAAKEACVAAGPDLFNMLEHMCSRPDYVAHFRANAEMENILSELEERLQDPDHSYFQNSAKVFYTLLTTAKTLGLSMHLLMPRCLTVIDNWCKNRLQAIHDNKVTRMDILGLDYMFGAAAAMLSSHPEHAIFDMSVKGSGFLKLAKRCYPNATSKKNKEALIEYFLAHL